MQTSSTNRFKKVAITATVSGEAGRAYLSGAFSYINEHQSNWTIEVFDNPQTVGDRLADSRDLDGAIIMAPHSRLSLDTLQRAGVPAVITDIPPTSWPKDATRISFVRLDDEAIGVAAAEHLLSRSHFNAFACFIDEPQYKYPHLRESGFRKRLASAGAFVKTLTLQASDTNPRDLTAFHLMLDRLPRPLGVFAVRDRAAPRIYDYCREFGISIPDEIAILGVDNDEIFCNTQRVQLSSILPNHWQIGYLAAKELNRLMRGGHGRD
ncbi:MAG: substrate-binding domain-containing protein, partial [bacterium]|nr:substrate-binding domain-containing protein [Candidatus Colisoma equi]